MVDYRPKLAMGADLNERQSDGSVVISREMVSHDLIDKRTKVTQGFAF